MTHSTESLDPHVKAMDLLCDVTLPGGVLRDHEG